MKRLRHRIRLIQDRSPDVHIFAGKRWVLGCEAPRGEATEVVSVVRQLGHLPSACTPQTGKQDVQYLFKLFGSFYEWLKFTYDEQNRTPSFFEESGCRKSSSRAWLGARQVTHEGVALVIATMIAVACRSARPLLARNLPAATKQASRYWSKNDLTQP